MTSVIKEKPKFMGGGPIIVLVATFLIMAANAMSMYKLATLMSPIMSYFNVGEGMIGILQSAQSWVVIFLLVPAGIVLRRFPPKYTGAVGLGLLVIGGAFGYTASSFTFLIIGRVLEGIGAMMVDVLAQTIAANCFPGSQTAAVGIVNCGNFVGQIAYYNVAPIIVASLGWQNVYLICGIFQIVVCVFWLIVIKGNLKIDGTNSAVKEQETKKEKFNIHIITKPLKERDLWFVAIGAACFGCAIPTFGTFIPNYFTTLGMSLTEASSLYSWAAVFAAIAMLCCGFVAKKLGSKKKMSIIFFWASVGVLATMLLPANMMFIFVALSGLIPRMLQATNYASLPDLYEDKKDVPVANSFMHLIVSLCNMLSAVFIGFLVENQGYTFTVFVMMAVMFLGGLLWCFIKKVK